MLELILWIIDVGILFTAIVLIIYQQRKVKKFQFFIGLLFLCLGFIIGRIFRIIGEFFIGLPPIGSYNENALYFLNLYYFILFGILLLIGAITLNFDKIKGKFFYLVWIILFISMLISTYIVSIIIEANVGEIPHISVLKGDILIFESIYIISSFIGYLILIIFVENVSKNLFYVNKTRHSFSVITTIAIIISVIQYSTTLILGEIFMLLFMFSMAGLFLVFLTMVIKSEGEVRRNSIYLCIGHILLVLCYGMDSREGFLMFGDLGNAFPLIPPIIHIIGLIFYFRGLLPGFFRQIKSE